MARRDDGAYWAYVTEEQRRQPRGPRRGSRVGVEEGCPARELCESSRFQGTSRAPVGAESDGVLQDGAMMRYVRRIFGTERV